MINTSLCNTKQRAMLWAAIYLASLFVSLIAMWWLVIIGGTPFRAQSAVFETAEIRAGKVAVVSYEICSEKKLSVYFFPSLYDSDGNWIPLQHGALTLVDGCSKMSHSFVVPELPPGSYTFVSLVKFQNNLIGRDENEKLPDLPILVRP